MIKGMFVGLKLVKDMCTEALEIDRGDIEFCRRTSVLGQRKRLM